MKCTSCCFENTADAKFCENCGQPMEHTCPNCGKPVTPTAKFCKNCGQSLVSATTASAPMAATKSDSLDALRRAAPQNVAQKILAERDKMEGERKHVTALFTDIVGSTSIAEQMDPEDWREIVLSAHRCVSEAVYRYEGTIAQLLSDGVLAFFGAPIAHEDDAERAIRAALDILASIEKYSNELRQRNRVQNFQMRVGLHSGLVVVGNIGSDLHMEYLAIGDTVNLAARMQSAAEPDTILISDSTHRLAGSVFEFDDRGKISVKGKTEPVQVYRVLSKRKGAVRAHGIAGLTSPMVGRSREFSTLLQIISDVHGGRGSIVAVIAEAGLGKSRLITEWRKAAFADTSTPIRWIEGRCLSYASSMAHHLSTDILRAFIGVPVGSSEEETHAALKRALDAFGADAKDIYPLLGHLLGLKLEEEAAARVKYLQGPALQAQYIAAYKKLLQLASHAAPTVIVCEDIHWADPSSVGLGSQILSIAATDPIVFVFVARPDKESAGWRLIAQAHEIAGVGVTELYLAPLSESDSKQLVSNLLNVKVLLESLRQLILAKAEGNPFFVEEVLRMLIDRGGIAFQDSEWTVMREISNIEIPDTLQGVLTARIDRLPEDAKRTLQIAAVIGRKFNVKVLERVLELQADSTLTQLEAAQLVRRVHEEESAYIFKHALTQDAAYQSLLVKQRRELHRHVAQAYEQIFADRSIEYVAILAGHYSEAGEDEKAFEYRIKAGNVALRSYAYAEARLHYANALESAARLPDNDDNRRRRVDTIVRLASTSFAAEATERKMRLLLEAEFLAKQLVESPQASDADRLRLARVYFWLGDLHMLRNELREELAYDEKAAVLARELGNENLLAIISHAIGRVYQIQGHFGDATQMLTQAVPQFEKTGNWSEWIWALGFLGVALAAQGRLDAGLAAGRRAVARAQQINHLTGIAYSQTTLSLCYIYGGDLPRALETSRSAISVAEQTGEYQIACFASGFASWAETRLGQHDAALNSMARVMKIAQRIGGKVIIADWYTFIQGEIAFNLGRIDEALTLAQRAAEMARSIDGLFAQGHAHRVWGQALAASASPRWDEVESHMAASLHAFETGQAHVEAARTQVAWGNLRHKRGDIQAAREHFQQAVAILEQTDLTVELEETRGLLADTPMVE